MRESPCEVAFLLQRWGEGDARAFDELIPLVYDSLRQLAHQRLRNESNGSVNTTALVHEGTAQLKRTPAHSS